MHRLISTVIIFILTLLIITAGFAINTRTTNSINEKINTAIELNTYGEIEDAKNIIQTAIDEWDNHIETMLLFESHGKLDQIEESLKIAQMYIKNGETEMFNAECKRASILIDHFNSLEYPTIYNIF